MSQWLNYYYVYFTFYHRFLLSVNQLKKHEYIKVYTELKKVIQCFLGGFV